MLYFVPIEPQSVDKPRNITYKVLEKPPPFMETVKKMRTRFLLHMKNDRIEHFTKKTCIKRWERRKQVDLWREKQ